MERPRVESRLRRALGAGSKRLRIATKVRSPIFTKMFLSCLRHCLAHAKRTSGRILRHVHYFYRCGDWPSFAARQVAARSAPMAERSIVGSLRALTVMLSLSSCSFPIDQSIFAQSPKEMLSTILRLYDLNAGTKVDEYARILGGRLKLTYEDWEHFFPAQRYTLDGSTENYGVELEIYGLGGTMRNPGTRVLIRMFGLNRLACIPRADIDALRSVSFQILKPLPPPAPQIGYSVVRPHNPQAPYPYRIMNVSYDWRGAEPCVNVVLLDFSPISDGWGH